MVFFCKHHLFLLIAVEYDIISSERKNVRDRRLRCIMTGYFITVEGSDGSGKSTQLQNMIAYLQQRGLDVVVTREPGGTPVAEAIRALILDPSHTAMTAETEMLLYAASRAQHVAEKILPAKQAGKVVLSDRFVDSSIAYQGYGRGLGDMVAWVNDIATGGLRPDLTIFLDVPPEIGMARKQREVQHQMDRLEQEEMAFHQAVYAGYLALCKAEPERICRVDATGTAEEVFEQIQKTLDAHLGFLEKR